MAQVTFVQRSISAQSTNGTNVTTTATGHASALAGDIQVLLAATSVSATPSPVGTGWMFVSQTSTSLGMLSVWTRLLTAGNIAQAQAGHSCVWSDYGRFEVRTYRNAVAVNVMSSTPGLIAGSQTIPDESMLLRVVSSYVNSGSSRNLTADTALVNSTGTIGYVHYSGLSMGDEPGAALTVAPSRTHTVTSTNNNPLSTDISILVPQDMTTAQVSNLTALPYSNGTQISWTASTAVGVSNYEYRVDGGTPVVATSSPVQITGLTNGVASTVEVRPMSGSNSGIWASVSVTPILAYVYDDFNRSNIVPSSSALGAPISGPTWTQPFGSMGIIAGAAYATSAGEHQAIVPAAYNIDATLVMQGSGADVGLLFRHRDVSNTWLLQVEVGQPARLYRRVAGTYNSVGTFSATIVANSKIRVNAVDSTIYVYLNDKLIYTLEDVYGNPATDTAAGLRFGTTTGRADMVYIKPAVTIELDSTGSLVSVVDTSEVETEYEGHVYKGRDSKILDTTGAV